MDASRILIRLGPDLAATLPGGAEADFLVFRDFALLMSYYMHSTSYLANKIGRCRIKLDVNN